MICLNDKFSTTRMVTTIKPIINNKPDDKFNTLLFSPKNYHRKFEGGLRTQGYFKQNSPENPLVTIITVVFNGEKYLEETILSVINQTYNNVEYIIIDGGSTDGTLEIIGKYENAIDYWVSEPDQGIYDAMNKGIKLATGQFIGIVNSDDTIYPSTVQSVVSAFEAKPEAQYTFGKVELARENGQIYGIAQSNPNKQLKDFTKNISMPFPHMTIYARREIYKLIGLFNTKYRLSADYDFCLKLIKQKILNVEITESIGFFRCGGRSGGIKTWIDTKEVLVDNSLWSIFSYKLVCSSILKSYFVRIVPFTIVKLIKRFRQRSTTRYF
jgi:glycosyltransferase involved in cell wall biosynthesis